MRGQYLSMTLDIANNPVIAYFGNPGTLRVAHCDALACTGPVFNDLQSALGLNPIDTSIAMDPDTDFPVVSYIDDTDPAGPFMAVAHCDDAVALRRARDTGSLHRFPGQHLAGAGHQRLPDHQPLRQRHGHADGHALHRPAVHSSYPGAGTNSLTRDSDPPQIHHVSVRAFGGWFARSHGRAFWLSCSEQTWSMDVATALGTYLTAVDSAAPGMIEGLYVVGSFALDDWHPGRSDIDIVAMMAEPATDDDFAALRTAHAVLAEHQPLPHIDGPYLRGPTSPRHPQPVCIDHGRSMVSYITTAIASRSIRSRGTRWPPTGSPSAGRPIDMLNIWHEVEDRVRLRHRQPDDLLEPSRRLGRRRVRGTDSVQRRTVRVVRPRAAATALHGVHRRRHLQARRRRVRNRRDARLHARHAARRARRARRRRQREITTAMMLGAADVISWTVNEVRQASA